MQKKGEITRQKIMDFLKIHYLETGYPPTIREIATAVNLKSTASVHTHLNILEQQGLIKRDPFNSRTIEITDQSFKKIDMEMIQLPIVGDVAAGIPILATENIEDYFPIPAGFAPKGNLFMLKVKGESMIEAGIMDGDLIMVKQQNTANNGDMIVALLDECATVKTFYKKSDYVVLQPENSAMEPIIVRENLKILGKVFGVYRFLL